MILNLVAAVPRLTPRMQVWQTCPNKTSSCVSGQQSHYQTEFHVTQQHKDEANSPILFYTFYSSLIQHTLGVNSSKHRYIKMSLLMKIVLRIQLVYTYARTKKQVSQKKKPHE